MIFMSHASWLIHSLNVLHILDNLFDIDLCTLTCSCMVTSGPGYEINRVFSHSIKLFDNYVRFDIFTSLLKNWV